MRLKLIACEILYREFCAAVARSANQVDLEFLPKGLHDVGQAGMSSRLVEVLGEIDESKYDAVLLGYALFTLLSDRNTNSIIKIAVAGIAVGFIVLLGITIADRVRESKDDRYKGVMK